MSRQVSILRTHIPISRIALFGLIGLLILCTPAALLAISNPPTSYQGAPMNLPVAANSGYFLLIWPSMRLDRSTSLTRQQ